MRIPDATYRLQFTPDFGFLKASGILDYLQTLGISDIYASPVFFARPGSTHGYDVVDPNALNPELGTSEEFDGLMEKIHDLGLGWVQDIVPNHMAFDKANPYLVDVLENGSSSRFYDFFDINWDHFYEIFRGKILAPFLGGFFGEALEGGQLKLSYDREGFSINYYDQRFALKIESYAELLTPCMEAARQHLGEENPDYIQLLGILYVLETLRTEPGDLDRYNQIKFIKNTFWNLVRKNSTIRKNLENTLLHLNGEPGNLETYISLGHLLSEQNFRLSYWKVAAEEINYRRFFSINDLISLRAEREEVFENTHAFIREQVTGGRFTGLRVDHIDGLSDPAAYLERVRRMGGDIYLLVEKILEVDEPLPDWPIQGTTGYEFMNRVAGLFCRTENRKQFNRLYLSFSGTNADYGDLEYEKKKLIIERHMIGDINNLAHLLKNIASRHPYGSDITMYSLRRSLMEIMACFPVYRTYFHPGGERKVDRRYIGQAIQQALARNPGLTNEIRYLRKILLLEMDEYLPEEEKTLWLQFIMRYQQFTGPLMAKGFEDTLLYVYNRLLSLNEVGGDPERFGFTPKEIHAYLENRALQWPHGLSAMATHDTKRGEDVRARLNVLSEIPQEWRRQVREWSRLNRDLKGRIGRRKMPTTNDEYFLYQTLLGTWPNGGFDREKYLERIRDYVVKAVREAKVHTAWIKPDSDYEETYLRFVEGILHPGEENAFLRNFLPFQRRIAFFGFLNSLSQTLIKLVAPGVPDFYQGTEFWDLSLVDPDNRRPVDYEARRRALKEIRAGLDRADLSGFLTEILENWQNGLIKLFLIYRTLEFRKKNSDLFGQGNYLPLETGGLRQDNLFAFSRELEDTRIIMTVPLFLCEMVDGEKEDLPLGESLWEDTFIIVPESRNLWRNVLTGETIEATGKIRAADAFRQFPVGLLVED